jgi:hypothetical protein
MSGCQFKLLRESSLISNKPKNIHARFEQPLTDRVVYQYNTAKMRYIKDIASIVPPSYNKYLVKKGGFGYNRKKRLYKIVCTPKGCFKKWLRGSGRTAADKGIDCTIPNSNSDQYNVEW